MTADDIITAARSALGAPFRHTGRTLAGMDCAGLVVHVARKLDIPVTDAGGYTRQPSNGLLETMLDMQTGMERVTGQPQAGDILLMRFRREPQHLGIFTGTNLIHAYEPNGKVVEHGFIGPWPRRLVRVYRFKGIEK